MINVSVIPKGAYCYEGLSVQTDSEVGFRYKVKPCPFYVHVNGLEGKCSAFNLEIIDQVKECDINDDIDENDLYPID